MVNCKMSANSPNQKVNQDDIINVRIEDEPPLVVEDPAPGRDSVDVDNDNSLTTYERMAQKMLDALRAAYNLDPTGELRGVAVMVTTDNGKIWNVMADSTEAQAYKDQEVWGKAYVEAEVAKTKTAYAKSSSGKASPV